MVAGTTRMGRPKKGATDAPRDRRQAVIHLKGSAAYVDWLESIYRKTHLPKATIVRLAIAEWAERHGHAAPPEL
ncbi:hypothetical protein EP7_005679 (plasmid) [Isosphaeraceae bacterium EP7]